MKVPVQDGVQNEIDIRKMAKGEYFGEKALLGEGKRTANIYAASPEGVELLCLYRKWVLSSLFFNNQILSDFQVFKLNSF